ncbi:DUF4287 domain-containing protein [Microbacterium sp. B35-30]|uniref:DUF4287 domain-containing protein n=1 Tax=Microbacterium sp. B35-30 TaxID=1962642 RepID=UPI0013D398BB|nr:DUF4287 domain-containing protein [Microbacterium sp. B35-30]KAF2420866.1 hypothetical protein B2K11_00585 [Microbacterium sp. B35-30]
MSKAQAYLDNVETSTGLTPRTFIELADERGLGSSATKTGEIIAWLQSDYELGHGQAMAIAQVITHRDTVDIKNADTMPEPPTSIGRLWLDGKDARPW